MDIFLHIDLEKLVRTIGYFGVFGMVFAESGLLIGVILPGDSLLFTAGFLASAGVFNIYALALGCFIAAVVGDNVGYAFGKRYGRRLFSKEESFWFHKKNISRAEEFYKKHGGKAIILARFTPIIRTFAPIVAGIGSMHYRTFFWFNIAGAFLWAVGVTLAGYFLGQAIPNVDKYLLPIVALIILVSLLPSIIHLINERRHRKTPQ
ncbi:MAG TPA: VTT domain-containing protein [Candidatus Saccharimonadales bacterium]|nr:VTT domain-containing protein [Candidatus Saccharimonadales bacterium]